MSWYRTKPRVNPTTGTFESWHGYVMAMLEGTGGIAHQSIPDRFAREFHDRQFDVGYLQYVFRLPLEEQQEHLGPEWSGLV